MKTKTFTTAAAAIAAGLIVTAMPGTTSTEQLPTGELNVNRTLVRVGASPQLEWDVRIPSIVRDLVEITPEGGVILKSDLQVRVRVLGVGYGGANFTAPTRAKMSLNHGGSWSEIFNGTELDVNPTEAVYSGLLPKGTRIDFLFDGPYQATFDQTSSPWERVFAPAFDDYLYWIEGSRPPATTLEETIYVDPLVNGDLLPDYTPAFSNQGSAEDFLQNYLHDDNTINIGPRDIIYLADVNTEREFGDPGVDMQDVVILVTFDSPDTP